MDKLDTLLFFGSFNPFRSEHLLIAERALQATGAPELWFIVSPQNPLKDAAQLAEEHHRLEMARLGAETSSCKHRMNVSDIEFGLAKPSLTIHTLEKLREEYPRRHFVLLGGSDIVDEFDRWVRYEDILRDFPPVIYPREGYTPCRKELADRFTFLRNVPPGVGAATDIREMIARGDNPQELLPAPVWQYIEKHGLYGYKGSHR